MNQLKKRTINFFIGIVFLFTVIIAGCFLAFNNDTKGHAAASEVPVIIKTTDAVKRGEQFSINGEGFDENSRVFIAQPSSSATPNGATELAITQRDDAGQYLVCQMPANQDSGVFDLWVQNSVGYSQKYVLNGARLLFISEYEGWQGQYIDVSGRNFDVSEFSGGNVTPTVTLVNKNGGATHTANVVEFNRYRVRFTIPNIPNGTYDIKITTNSFYNASLTNGQTLTIIDQGSDPLNLNAPWARHINWNNVVNATSYGFSTSNSGDANTNALQSAVNAAHSAGGGIVSMPAGTFNLRELMLKSNVALIGAGKDQTILNYTGGANQNIFINKTEDIRFCV